MKFDIYAKNMRGSRVLITSYDPAIPQYNLYATFDEKIKYEDNDRIELTFSIAKKVPNDLGQLELNPNLRFIKFGNIIYFNDGLKNWDLVISNIEPQIGNNNAIYNVTCQDYLSYKWSRMRLGYSYSTLNSAEGAQTVFVIAQKILADCGLSDKWKVQRRNSHLYPNSTLKTQRTSLEIENSNPYNALIELLNTVNASMLVDYNTKELRFYQKDRVLFSGYRYRPETNLRSLSASYNFDEYASILHVTGGTDEYDSPITLVPAIPGCIAAWLTKNPDYNGLYTDILTTSDFSYIVGDQDEINEVNNFCTIADKIPYLGQFLCNFDYFIQSGLMSSAQQAGLNDLIYNRMRKVNIKLKLATEQYYKLSWEVNKTIIDAESQLELINATYNGEKEVYIDSPEDKEEKIEGYKKDREEAFFQFDNLLNGSFKAKFKQLYGSYYGSEVYKDIADKVVYYQTMRDDAYKKYNAYQNQYETLYGKKFDIRSELDDDKNIIYEKIKLQEEIAYYYDRYYYALQMVGYNDNMQYDYLCDYLNGGKSSQGNEIDSYYLSLQNRLNTITSTATNTIYNSVNLLEEQNKQLWNEMYRDYGNFIYEAIYENDDEMNSVSLYNQATSYYEEYHHPKSDYSIEVIHLEELEQIAEPNLKVNSRIRIYNEELELAEGEYYPGKNTGDASQEKLNNISFTNNEVVITSLTYELRKSAALSISVQRLVQYQSILQKLIKNIK